MPDRLPEDIGQKASPLGRHTSYTFMVEWATADQPAGVEVVRFQILVINEADDRFQFSATVPADVTSITVPVEFLATLGDTRWKCSPSTPAETRH